MATLETQPLPPHVVVTGIGKWAYIYCLEADFAGLVSILAHLPCIFEDLEINSTPLPTVMQTLRNSAAAGVAKRLANEKTTLVRSSTPTTVPARTRLALSSALSCHINSIKELRSATTTTFCVPPTAADTELQPSASTPRPTRIRHVSRPSCATSPRHGVPTLTHDGSEPAVITHTP